MNSEILNSRNELTVQFFVFRLVERVSVYMLWPFYYIELYKQAQSLEILILERAVAFTGLWCGFVAFTFLIDKFGYLRSFQISSILQILSFILILYYINDLKEMYILLALVWGIAHGTFWPISNSIELKEFSSSDRGRIYSMFTSASIILSITLPVLAGALISYKNDFSYIVLITIAVFTVPLFKNWTYNKTPISKIRSEEITLILKTKNVGKYLLFEFLDAGFTQIYAVLFLIIPYLLLKDELGVGIFAALAGMLAAVNSFHERNSNMEQRAKFGNFGYSVLAIATILLSVFWVVPMLAIRIVVLGFTTPLSDSSFREIQFSIREKLLGDFKNESAQEFNIIIETVIMFSRVSVLLFFYVILSEVAVNIDDAIRIVIALFAFYRVIIFNLLRKLNFKLKI